MRRGLGVPFSAAPVIAQTVTALRFERLWDGDKVIDRAVVMMENGRIRGFASGDAAPPAGAGVVDWSRFYGLPGLIEVHR